MKPSLRQVVADSHVAAIAIVLLLLWPVEPALRILWPPLYSLGSYLATAVAIRGIPSSSPLASPYDRLMFDAVFILLLEVVSAVTAAWLLSRWVYGEGLLRSLTRFRERLPWRNYV